MTRLEILAFFAPGTPIHFGGASYAVATWDWVEKQFYPDFKALLWSEDLNTWAVKWECRDFARGFAYEAQKRHALTPGSPDGEDCIAIGEIWFIPDPGHDGINLKPPYSGHAINACITDLGLVFIDPQTGLQWKMTQSELLSVSFVRF